jgi:cytochrome P450
MNQRFGAAFTMRLPVFGPTVTITDPALAKELYQQPSSTVQGIDANLGLVFGPGSIFSVHGEEHRRHRKLILPPFHGSRMRAYEGLIEEETLREIADWPDGRQFAVLPSTLNITLNTILRAVFGADESEADALRALIPRMMNTGQPLAVLPWLRRDWGRWSPWGRFLTMRAQFDTIVGSLVDKVLADPAVEERTDVLSLLVQARYDDGTAMSRSDIADELLTLVAAGHETTATSLAWAAERLRRHPDVLSRLVNEIDAEESTLLRAVVLEVLRTRPVIEGSARKVIAPSIRLGPWVIPRGYNVAVSISLTHLNEHVYDDAVAFKPERFLSGNPDPYSWVPFGGGNRRCPGAAFAEMEMQVVLRTVLRELELIPTTSPGERWQHRGVAFGPADGGRALVRRRRPFAPRVDGDASNRSDAVRS